MKNRPPCAALKFCRAPSCRTTTCWSAKPRMFGASVIRRAFPWIEMPGMPSKRSAKVRAASEASSSAERTVIAAGAVSSGVSARDAVTTTVSANAGSGEGSVVSSSSAAGSPDCRSSRSSAAGFSGCASSSGCAGFSGCAGCAAAGSGASSHPANSQPSRSGRCRGRRLLWPLMRRSSGSNYAVPPRKANAVCRENRFRIGWGFRESESGLQDQNRRGGGRRLSPGGAATDIRTGLPATSGTGPPAPTTGGRPTASRSLRAPGL